MSRSIADTISPQDMPEAVQWHEGMMLTPQHFQQSTQRMETFASYIMHRTTPFPWGIHHIEIDQTALAAGQFRVLKIEVVFPDGLVYVHPCPGAPELELNLLTTDIDLQNESAVVHVAVPRHSERAAAPGALRRYHSVESPVVVDENLGENPVTIPRLRPAASLFVTDSPLIGPGAAYVSLPLAKVGMLDGKTVLLHFQPPLLQVIKGEPIHQIARDVAVTLRETVMTLVERLKSARTHDGAETAEVAIALRAISTPLLRLEVHVRHEVVRGGT